LLAEGGHRRHCDDQQRDTVTPKRIPACVEEFLDGRHTTLSLLMKVKKQTRGIVFYFFSNKDLLSFSDKLKRKFFPAPFHSFYGNGTERAALKKPTD
jgi:hypothetical protein